ncbi:haloacid dehalogenase-like hydrolase [Brachybacterium sp. DNPG3]
MRDDATNPTADAHDGPDLVVYDLDGVLTRRDSFTAFLVDRLRRDPRRLLRTFPPTLAMLLSRREEQRMAWGRRATRIALAGLADDELAAHADGFGRRIGADPSWIRAEVVGRIRAQRAAGTRIVIATATERHLAEGLLTAAGVPYDLLSASILGSPGACAGARSVDAGAGAGVAVLDHRVGSRKLAALRELGLDIGRAEFATDAASDLPTARAAARVVLVGATERTRRDFARAGVEVAERIADR